MKLRARLASSCQQRRHEHSHHWFQPAKLLSASSVCQVSTSSGKEGKTSFLYSQNPHLTKVPRVKTLRTGKARSERGNVRSQVAREAAQHQIQVNDTLGRMHSADFDEAKPSPWSERAVARSSDPYRCAPVYADECSAHENAL